MQNILSQNKQRNFALDILRVLACFLVIWQHAGEFYYIGTNIAVVREASTYQIGWLSSADRTCIALFVMISGYFLLPMKLNIRVFFKKRFTRILFPFIFWCITYAFYYVLYRGDSIQTCLLNIARIPVNWGVEVGHLWYVYMLIGLYLLIPVISPFLERSSKRTIQAYLAIWAATTLLPYAHLIFPSWLGECGWNPTPLYYYFNGFAGYLVLGYYAKRYGVLHARIATVILLTGYIVTVLGYNALIPTATDCNELEIPWGFCTLNVAMMSYGIFSLISSIRLKGTSRFGRLITDFSIISYGIYLSHIMVLNFYHDLLTAALGTVLLQIPVITVCTFITTYFIIKLLSFLPKSHFWIGA